MDWNLSWIILGCIAYFFAILNLIRTATGKTKGWQIFMFCSLSFGVLTLLEEYRMINQWLYWGEMNAISNTVPSLTEILTITTYVGILINLVVLIINLYNKKDQGGEQV